ncbi:hypothetical protein J7K24_02700 [bacterium]|nr:hypothetical protein [bacterium]
MLTIFSIPKPFNNTFRIIQTNAIKSWVKLPCKKEIILFGNEAGTKEIAVDYNIRWYPEIRKNRFNTPLLDEIFEKAQRLSTYDLLVYVNADIILAKDFLRAVKTCSVTFDKFLMVGQRWNLDVKKEINFDDPEWFHILKERVKKEGKIEGPSGIDYFVFRRGSFLDIPSFAIGRTVWDNWLLWKAWQLGIPIVDATGVVLAIHQNHSYSFSQGKKRVWKGEEALENLRLAGGETHMLTIRDSDFKLTSTGVRKQKFSLYRIFSFSIKYFEKANIFVKIFLFPFWFAIYLKRKISKFIV